MNPPSAKHIKEALAARDELYRTNETDPDKWEQVASMLKNVGFEFSWKEIMRKAKNLRKVKEKQND